MKSENFILRRDQCIMSEDFRNELQHNSERPQVRKTKDDVEVPVDFWLIQEDFIYRHHNDPQVQLYTMKEKMFSYSTGINWRDQERSHTRLDDLQENAVTTTGMSIQANIDEIYGKISRSSFYWKRFSKRTHEIRRGDWQNFK